MSSSTVLQTAAHPIVGVLAEGIVREIHETRKAGLYRAALILLYCGIDQVSYLAMPVGQKHATRSDFVRWVETYLRRAGTPPLSGEELYGARCAIVHKYGTAAKLHGDDGSLRQLCYMVEGPTEVYCDPKTPGFVGVEINYLIDAFIQGVVAFTRDVENALPEYREAVNLRLHSMVAMFSISP